MTSHKAGGEENMEFIEKDKADVSSIIVKCLLRDSSIKSIHIKAMEIMKVTLTKKLMMMIKICRNLRTA